MSRYSEAKQSNTDLFQATGHGKGVFCKKITEDDALQGALGNCFAIAAFGTWAGVKGRITYPGFILKSWSDKVQITYII